MIKLTAVSLARDRSHTRSVYNCCDGIEARCPFVRSPKQRPSLTINCFKKCSNWRRCFPLRKFETPSIPKTEMLPSVLALRFFRKLVTNCHFSIFLQQFLINSIGKNWSSYRKIGTEVLLLFHKLLINSHGNPSGLDFEKIGKSLGPDDLKWRQPFSFWS